MEKIGKTWVKTENTFHGTVYRKPGFIRVMARKISGVLFEAEAPDASFWVLFLAVGIGLEILLPVLLGA